MATLSTHRKRPNVLAGLVVGSSATASAVLFSHPMETLKTRFQLQGELMKRGEGVRIYTGVMQGLRMVAAQEGPTALYAGLGAGVLYQIVMNGTRLGLFEPLREQIAALYPGDSRPSTAGGVIVGVVSGTIVGVLGGGLASPFFQAKVRLQMGKSAAAMGLKAQYAYAGTAEALQDIYRAGGVSSLFRGSGIAMLRTGVGSATQLSSYGFCKDIIRGFGVEDGVPQHLMASTLAALVCTTAINPIDVVMTRIYNQSADKSAALYKSPFEAFALAIRTEGLGAFYKGWGAHFARLGPHTILTFVFLEQYKLLATRLGY